MNSFCKKAECNFTRECERYPGQCVLFPWMYCPTCRFIYQEMKKKEKERKRHF